MSRRWRSRAEGDFEPAEPDLEDVYFSMTAGHIGRHREQPEPAVVA